MMATTVDQICIVLAARETAFYAVSMHICWQYLSHIKAHCKSYPGWQTCHFHISHILGTKTFHSSSQTIICWDTEGERRVSRDRFWQAWRRIQSLKQRPKWMTVCLNEIKPVITQNPVPRNIAIFKALSNHANHCNAGQCVCFGGE